MEKFGMEMDIVDASGRKVDDLGGEFGYSKRRIKEIKNTIVDSAYTSDDAQAIGRKIDEYDPLLNMIEERLRGFGNFGVVGSNMVSQTNETIKDKVVKSI